MNKLLTSIICMSLMFQTSFALGQESPEDAAAVFNQLLQQADDANSDDQEGVAVIIDIDDIDIELPENDSNFINSVVEDVVNDQSPVQEEVISEPVVAPRDQSLQAYQQRMDMNDNGFFDYIKYNELRDTSRHDANLRGTSRKILEALAEDTFSFTQENDVRFYLKNTNEVSAIGPHGSLSRDSQGKSIFNINPQMSRSERRTNVVMSISFDRVVDVTRSFDSEKTDSVFDMDLLLFINNNEERFFKRIVVNVNWLQKINDGPKISVLAIGDRINLSETNFEVRTELKSLKTILIDSSRHGIIRVFPTTAGAVDARGGIDGEMNSMSLMLPSSDSNNSGRFKDFKFGESVLIKKNIWRDGRNTSSRTSPGYYKGRPFLGIIDKSRVQNLQLNNENNFVLKEGASSANYGTGYREVGYHYQITDYDIKNDDGAIIGKAGLKRTFDSHGCLRLQDHDLYMLHDVLNFGPHDQIPVEVKLNFGGRLAEIDSVYSKSTHYKKVVYSNKPGSPNRISCEDGSVYQVRKFNNFHTIADKECLTQIFVAREEGENLTSLVSYIDGQGRAPVTKSLGSVEHPAVAFPYLRDNIDSVRFVRPEFSSYDIIKGNGSAQSIVTALELYNYMVRADVIDYLNQHFRPQNTGFQSLSESDTVIVNPVATGLVKWPTLRLISNSETDRVNFHNYNDRCARKVINYNNSTPAADRPLAANCDVIYKALNDAGAVAAN